MSRSPRLAAVAAAALAALTVSACGSTDTSDPDRTESRAPTEVVAKQATAITPALSATGPHGERLEFATVPTRIVCITGLCDDIAAQLQITPVGTTTPDLASADFEFGPAGEQIEVIPGSFGSEDVAAIAALKPDLVIGLGGVHEKLVPALEKFTQVLIVDPENYQDSIDYLQMVATVADRPEQARAAEQRLYDAIAEGQDRVAAAGADDLAVAAMWGSAEAQGIETTESPMGSVLDEVFEYPFVALSDDPMKAGAYSIEEILEQDPAVIFLSSMTFSPDDPQASEVLAENPVWAQITAVKNDQVHEVDKSVWQFCRGTGCMVEVLGQAVDRVEAAATK